MAIQEKGRSNGSNDRLGNRPEDTSVGAARRRLNAEKQRDFYRIPKATGGTTTSVNLPTHTPAYSPTEEAHRKKLSLKQVQKRQQRRIVLVSLLSFGCVCASLGYIAPKVIHSHLLQQTENAEKELGISVRAGAKLTNEEHRLQRIAEKSAIGALQMEKTPVNDARRRILTY
jgi:hypothetical protein